MLTIPLETVGWIIVKAREFDAKDMGAVDEMDREDDELSVLENHSDDPTEFELTSWISDLNRTEQAELVALFWLGRDDGLAEDFPNLVEQARGYQGKRTAPYLLGSPLLGDHLEAGLEILGYDTGEIESTLT
jgi:hypothetical protein